ncbi:hypothetical protein HDU96_002364 [Phlyctochytrium bullatum]|nr:hypothetical protein HDU96_002364 [Phlyctochytrium bullatum]
MSTPTSPKKKGSRLSIASASSLTNKSEPLPSIPSESPYLTASNPEVVITVPALPNLPASAGSPIMPTVPEEGGNATVGSQSKRSSLSVRSIPLSPASKALVDQSLLDNYPLSPTLSRRLSVAPSVAPSRKSVRMNSADDLVKGLAGVTHIKEHRAMFQKASNEAKDNFMYLITINGSVLPHVWFPTLVVTLWTVFWVLIHQQAKWALVATQPLLISIIGVVLSLLLVFRNNTAYDRYWEGRRMWGSIITHCRNLGRVIWIMGNAEGNAQVQQEKRGALNLVLAFPIATKYLLRGKPGILYTDLVHLLCHVPAFNPKKPNFHENNVPMEILFHLTSYIYRARKAETYDVQGQTQFFTALTGLMDCLTNLERIRNSPIPLVYNIHLKIVVIIYLLALPFQLTGALNYFAIPVVFIASFIFLGIEAIALEIENPFGEDANDLPMEAFIELIRNEVNEILASDSKRDPQLWLAPLDAETIASRHSFNVPRH